MEAEKKITVDEFYNYITKHMTPEEALKKLLTSSMISYEKLKFEEGKEVHPLIIMANAAMDMGWMIAVEKNEGDVRGLAVGTEDYMERVFSK
jgi:hypothetical protein